jgi:hypothetical protein
VRGRNSRRRARGRGRLSGADNTAGSEDDDEEANGNDGSKESSSADEQSPPDDIRQSKRCKRWPSGSARSSPAKSTAGKHLNIVMYIMVVPVHEIWQKTMSTRICKCIS